MLLEAQHIEQSFGERHLLDIPLLQVYGNDKIGLVGYNGAGKTTLLDILSGDRSSDDGNVRCFCPIAYAKQFDETETQDVSLTALSGGERTQRRIWDALLADTPLLFVDEPTSNLDIYAIQQVEKALYNYSGALILISHDRTLMDVVCNKIWELEGGKLLVYDGNYSDYMRQKEVQRQQENQAYNQYRSEKSRIEASIDHMGSRAGRLKKAPSRMGNSEARLHKRSTTQIQGKLFRGMHALETRLNKLDKLERPEDIPVVKMDFSKTHPPTARIVVSCKDYQLIVGETNILAEDVTLTLKTGSKTAFVGGNGTGKTSLIKNIMDKNDLSLDNGIRIAPKVRFGYFSQDLDVLDPAKSILENVMFTSVQAESIVRTILARLMFRRDDVHKTVSVLSGGERVKVLLARIMVSDANVIILDEPTNYLDVYAMEALQQLLLNYEGTLLLVSHDRQFLINLSDRYWIFDDNTIQQVEAPYTLE